jgi:hypothetical protein
MKNIAYFIILALVVAAFVSSTNKSANLKAGFVTGTPGVKSVSALAFGPEGILFIGDSKSATDFALDTKDAVKNDKAADFDVKKIDQQIAAALGTQVENISITDIAINPLSKKLYCAVESADGTPVLLKITGDKIEPVSLKNVQYSTLALENSLAEDAKDQRGRPLRVWTISDMGFYDGKLMVSGLSNQEFSSTFRSIPFPFTKVQNQTSLEIYHAAHGKYETYAPIKTFTVAELKGKKYLIASYTCTPLVLFPLDELKSGVHVKGRTVAEMGSGNSPLDMVTMKNKEGMVLVMSNSSRPVMAVKEKAIEDFQGSLTTPVEEGFGTAGAHFVSMPMVNVLQMDKLDDERFVVMQRKANGDLDLWTGGSRYLN